jgi:ribonuclease BN (tRNA processing enzyme)
MRLTVLGSGDAFSSGGRLSSCYLVESRQARFLLECGPTVLTAFKKAGLSTNSISQIFISHLHGDHMGGLPFLLLDAIFPSQRQEPLTLIGPLGLEARFRMACEVFYPGSLNLPRPFDLNFVELHRDVRWQMGDLAVTPFEVDHFSGSPSYAYRFELDGRVFAFSGDAGWSDNVVRVGQGADLYLIECYQYDLELSMHLNYLQIAAHFDQINAGQLLLTHMSEAMLARQDDVDKARCALAHDGMIIDI